MTYSEFCNENGLEPTDKDSKRIYEEYKIHLEINNTLQDESIIATDSDGNKIELTKENIRFSIG
jgi:hypothetical protein